MAGMADGCTLSSGLKLSPIAVGLWQVADVERRGDTVDIDAACRDLMEYSEAGCTTLDMADHYGSAEEVVGAFISRASSDTRQAATVMTKWVPQPAATITREETQAAVHRSMSRLGVPKIALMQFHVWDFSNPSWLDALSYLQEMTQGDDAVIHSLGTTNMDTYHLRIALHSGIRIVSNQVCVSLLDGRGLGDMATLCREHGVRLLAYGTLGGGLLSNKWLGCDDPRHPDALDTWSQRKYYRFVTACGGWTYLQDLLKLLNQIADRHQVTVANVACRYVMQQDVVASVLVGMTPGMGRGRLEDTMRCLKFKLDDVDMNRIRDFTVKRRHTIPGDCGDEYRKAPYLTASGDLSHHLQHPMPTPYQVVHHPNGRSTLLSGTPWESVCGFSRAVRVGNQIFISGTTATHGDRPIGGSDPASQTHFILDKVEGCLRALGGCMEDVVRTRIYITNLDNWEVVSRVHGKRFTSVQPTCTMVQAGLIGDEYLVEMEVDALVVSP